MITFIGHGIFKEYSREFEYTIPETMGSLLKKCAIPGLLLENLIAVMDSKVLYLDYQVKDGDTIHIFLAVMGG